ncbi:MAG: hypothetical protein H0X62_15620 [Bacteroidetes bacterium]|nr:hypothetical protein [Bacteroidota bacterium]
MKRIFAAFSFVLLISIMASGCKKDEPTGCIITAKDLSDKPVVGANIYLHAKDIAPPKKEGDFEYKGKTDSQGKAYFDIPLEAIYTIEAVKDSISGFSRIRLRKGETVEESVILE